jgi:hypothetical protein
LQFLKCEVPHDTIHGVCEVIICCTLNRRLGPTNLLYQGLFGR